MSCIKQNMEYAVVRLQTQAKDLNLSEALKSRQQTAQQITVAKKLSNTSKDPSSKKSVFLTEGDEVASAGQVRVRQNGIRGGLLQTDEDNNFENVETFQRHDSNRGESSPSPLTRNEKDGRDAKLTNDLDDAPIKETKAATLTVDPEELMARATQDTLHFFRGIIFETQSVSIPSLLEIRNIYLKPIYI